MKKRLLSLALCFCMAVGVLVGCGNSNKGNTDTGVNEQEAEKIFSAFAEYYDEFVDEKGSKFTNNTNDDYPEDFVYDCAGRIVLDEAGKPLLVIADLTEVNSQGGLFDIHFFTYKDKEVVERAKLKNIQSGDDYLAVVNDGTSVYVLPYEYDSSNEKIFRTCYKLVDDSFETITTVEEYFVEYMGYKLRLKDATEDQLKELSQDIGCSNSIDKIAEKCCRSDEISFSFESAGIEYKRLSNAEIVDTFTEEDLEAYHISLVYSYVGLEDRIYSERGLVKNALKGDDFTDYLGYLEGKSISNVPELDILYKEYLVENRYAEADGFYNYGADFNGFVYYYNGIPFTYYDPSIDYSDEDSTENVSEYYANTLNGHKVESPVMVPAFSGMYNSIAFYEKNMPSKLFGVPVLKEIFEDWKQEKAEEEAEAEMNAYLEYYNYVKKLASNLYVSCAFDDINNDGIEEVFL